MIRKYVSKYGVAPFFCKGATLFFIARGSSLPFSTAKGLLFFEVSFPWKREEDFMSLSTEWLLTTEFRYDKMQL